jgi:ribose transport system permease protein
MTTDSTLAEVIGQRSSQGLMSWLASRQVFWVALATFLACVILSLVTTTFDTPGNIFNVTRNFAFVGLMAIGVTAVIITGGIDLSVGGVLLVGAMAAGMSMNAGMSIWEGFALAMAASLTIGVVNGVLIAVAGMPAFVVTLGMMSISRSLGLVISNNRLIYDFGPDSSILLAIGGGSFMGVPNPVYALVILMVLTSLAFLLTRWGRYLFAIGGNEQAAILTGVPVKTVKISVYVFSALCAGLTGFLQIGWLGSAATNLGSGMELTVIAAAVIGGANLLGGSGTAFGAVIGAALIEVIRNSLILLGISTFWQGTFVGSFIIIAVAFDRLRRSDASD